jgi:hypothetical protein
MRRDLVTISAAAMVLALGLAPAHAGAAGNQAPGAAGGPSLGAGGPSAPMQSPAGAAAGDAAAPIGQGAGKAMPDRDAAAPSAGTAQGKAAEPADPSQAGRKAENSDGISSKDGDRAGRTGADTATTDADRDGQASSADRDMKRDGEARSAESDVKRDGRDKAAKAEIKPEQKAKVRSYFSSNKPKVKRVERDAVSVSIGVVVPGSIALYALPADIVVVAGDCPLQYFVWGDAIVLVDSCSRHVVDIVPGVA